MIPSGNKNKPVIGETIMMAQIVDFQYKNITGSSQRLGEHDRTIFTNYKLYSCSEC